MSAFCCVGNLYICSGAVVVDIHLFVADINLCEDVVGGIWCKSLNYVLRIMVAFRLVKHYLHLHLVDRMMVL